jgi:hypothetical protein
MAAASRSSWNGLAAVIAALVGFLALMVSAYTAYIQRQQTRAQVWPRLLVGDRPADRLVVIYNKGMGPAIVRSVQVYVAGHPQPDWDHVAAAQGLKFSAPPKSSTIGSVVISPGEELHLLRYASDTDFTQAVYAEKAAELRICYCSVLDDCWVMDDRQQNPALRVTEAKNCPVDPASDFTE